MSPRTPNILGLIERQGRGRSEGLDYTHRPLAEQFSRLGIRQIELDIFADPEGGRYGRPAARAVLQAEQLDPGADPAADGAWLRPGFKVFHVQDIDYVSRATTLAAALGEVRAWSAAHPRHVPILVLFEAKHDAIAALPTIPAPFGAAELDALDAAIAAAFDPASIITPDAVRGDAATLPEAIHTRGWPTLEASRGKVIFALDDEGATRDLYLDGHPALRGRPIFVSVPPEHPAAAFMKANEPVRDFDRIQAWVRAGFLVRTRSDADTVEARRGDPSRRERALASGAQFVSTDYPEPDLRFSRYEARLPGGVVARANPVIGPPIAGDLEAADPALGRDR